MYFNNKIGSCIERKRKMFEIGDYIIYGNSGVCKIEKIGPMEIRGIAKDKLYYTLTPVFIKSSKVFTPIDNKKVVMRSILSREEANDLLEQLDYICELQVDEDKKREESYKQAIRTCDCKEYVKVIKTAYQKEQEKIANGKKVTYSDEKYMRMAKESLCQELSISLEVEQKRIEEFIMERIR